MNDNTTTLARATKDLCYQEPFYGLYLMMLNKYWDSKGVPSAGVSRNGINYQLSINEKFWQNLAPLYKLGILKHELLHICFFHLENHFDFEDHALANIAEDMEINQYIIKEWLPAKDLTKAQFDAKWKPTIEDATKKYKENAITADEYDEIMSKVPPRGIYIEDYAHLKLDKKAGSKYYYDKLKQNQNCKNPDPGIKQLLEQLNCGRHPQGHDGWGEFEGLTESEKKLLRTQVDYHLKQIADQVKSRGNVPSELAGYIDSLDKTEPPKFDWKRYMRRFSGGSTKIYTKKLKRKFNKRYEDNPGLKIKPKRHVLVAVDTSGSVSDKELKEFFHEIHHIHRNGSDVTILQSDAAISDIQPLKRGLEDQIAIKGRGGTDFNPACEYFSKNPQKYTCMIYFTDGECSPPDEPVRGKILWVLSSTSKENLSLPGLTIKLN